LAEVTFKVWHKKKKQLATMKVKVFGDQREAVAAGSGNASNLSEDELAVEVEDSGHAAADPSVYVERRKKGT
jgi:hypothetical protein